MMILLALSAIGEEKGVGGSGSIETAANLGSLGIKRFAKGNAAIWRGFSIEKRSAVHCILANIPAVLVKVLSLLNRVGVVLRVRLPRRNGCGGCECGPQRHAYSGFCCRHDWSFYYVTKGVVRI
jgi:hypothetical protein